MRVILPVGAGSGVDTIMRAAQNDLSKALGGQPVVIENLPGRRRHHRHDRRSSRPHPTATRSA
jgi:hypothetical protein